ncbi:hypothetical protein CDL12_15132 [Handroanthus impetiginosus]|uniref:Synergin gamma C-terminal domain-containing protein n=1 Tax=Handroanthus impetiginosus TaxID=429701 RepID=A0A2G9H4M6_9LAMI|nr:hypothetical protein CDL12_15132 [Handroanthus impetiginosus]
MAEDDDDETFGEFAFASFQSNSQSDGPNSLPNGQDDEWGDFVKSPLQLKPSAPFFKGNHPSDNSASPPQWVKPSGALPLSIFGDAEGEEEEEEEKGSLTAFGDFSEGKNRAIDGDSNPTLFDNDVSNSQNLSITDLYSQYSEIKPENGSGSKSIGRVDSVENGVHSTSNQDEGRSAITELKNVDLKDTVGITGHSQLANNCDNDELSFNSYVRDQSKDGDFFGGWTPDFTGINSNLNKTTSFAQTGSSDLHMNGEKQQLGGFVNVPDAAEDAGDDEWEFKDAYSEFRTEEVNNNVDLMAHEVSERSAYSPGTGNGSNKSLDLFGTSSGSVNLFVPSIESVDYFATSSGISSTSQEVDFFGLQPKIATVNGLNSDTNSIVERSNINGLLNRSSDVGSAEFDEDFGEFAAASAETGPNPWEVSSNAVLSTTRDAVTTMDTRIQEKDMELNHHKGMIPLSIFGNEEPTNGGTSDVQDVFMHQATSNQRNSGTPTSVISISDLISSLYSQAELTSSINNIEKLTTAPLSLPDVVSGSNLVNDGDHHDYSSWDFKDASQKRVNGESSARSVGETYPSIHSELKLNNYLDFYSKLKEELCFVAKCHLETLKQAAGNATLSGDDERSASVDSEYQLFCKELDQMNLAFEESNSQRHPSGDSRFTEFVEVLLEPQFQILESEYHLSQKLLTVEKDLRSAMELIRHTTTMLKILSTGTLEDQRAYVSIWSEMVSVCAQELKHGASIWNQAVEKHVQSQLLSEPQGRKFVLALGEIYRVVVILGASTKLFKPWTLSGSVGSPTVNILLEECHAVWSTSGLEEALSIVSSPTALDNASLFKSIKHILGLDAFMLQNHVFTEKESRCRLSFLTTGVAPGMKMVMWGNEECFVTLANLWANLISRDPPQLPQLNLG